MRTLTPFFIATIAFTLMACNKDAVRPGKLKGKTYEVQDVAVYEGTNYRTWVNTHEGEVGEGGWNITSSSGSFDFSKDGMVDIDVSFTQTNTFGDVYDYVHQTNGTLILSGKQDWFVVVGGPLGYEQYFIE
ncbi:MAG: hypothetical protein RLP15_05045 [Cryomorphaceae bacterium]